MFPWLAHGHISPYLHLAKSLLHRKITFHIYILTTPTNSPSISHFIHHHSLSHSLHPIDLLLEPSTHLPPHLHTTKNLPPNLTKTLLQSLQTSPPTFSQILTSLSPNLLIYDIFQPWASKLAAKRGIPSLHFSTNGAAPVSFAHHLHTFGNSNGFPFPAMVCKDHELKPLNDTFEFLNDIIFQVDRQDFLFGDFKESCDVVLMKTCRGIEGKYIDYLSGLCDREIVPVGPLVECKDGCGDEECDVIKWMNKKERYSTVFISFGSECFLTRNDIGEIAKGLESCEVNFIWVVRFPAGEEIDIEEVLPEGFLSRTGNRGMVITGWAPQTDILRHPSTGGFISHCGWSSVMESMYFGVAVIAMPMNVDQPLNARMLAEAGSCVIVHRNENEGYKGDEIAKAMKKVFAEEDGDTMRRRARDLSEIIRREEEETMDDAAEKLWQICVDNKFKGA